MPSSQGAFGRQGLEDYVKLGYLPVDRHAAAVSATLDYAYGGALDLTRPDIQLQDARDWIRTERRHAVAAKFSGLLIS